MAAAATAQGVHWHWGVAVALAAPGCLHLADGGVRHFDWIFDVRGTGARPAVPVRGEDHGFTPQVRGESYGFTPQVRGESYGFTPQVRGVRGEIFWLHAPGIALLPARDDP